MSTTEARRLLTNLVREHHLDLPAPGAGATALRWRSLFTIARDHDVSVARLAEAHVDAIAILSEAGLEPHGGALYGVWAAVGPGGHDVTMNDEGAVSGTKPFCSGLGIVDRALVEVEHHGRRQLVDIDVGPSETVRYGPAWQTYAMASTATADATFDEHCDVGLRLVGPPGWYLDRVGFWHGAIGPAACWSGAAAGLADQEPGDDDHRHVHRGAIIAEVTMMAAVLAHAGDEADQSPLDALAARQRALAVRYTIHESCLRLAEHHARGFAPRSLIRPDTAQRYADVHFYIRQYHADRDLVALSRGAADVEKLP